VFQALCLFTVIYRLTFSDHNKAIKETETIYNIPVLDVISIILKSHLHTQRKATMADAAK
jgi:hypothetical protein